MRKRINVNFKAQGALFFRGTRPHGAAGASILTSEFPAPATSELGALRTLIGAALNIDWDNLKATPEAAAIIGGPEDTGQISVLGSGITHKGEFLYSAPAALMTSPVGMTCLTLGNAVLTDLGKVRLPKIAPGFHGAKPLSGSWLTQAGMQRFLHGGLPNANEVVSQSELMSWQPVSGNAIASQTNTVKDGALFQKEHCRLHGDTCFSLSVELPEVALIALNAHLEKDPYQKLGAEGGLARVSLSESLSGSETQLTTLAAPAQANAIMLLSDLQPDNDEGAIPFSGFKQKEVAGEQVWEGEINAIALRIRSALAGKPIRRGGWDLVNKKPRPVKSFIPAGACYWAETIDPKISLNALHGTQVGGDIALGYGVLACVKLPETTA